MLRYCLWSCNADPERNGLWWRQTSYFACSQLALRLFSQCIAKKSVRAGQNKHSESASGKRLLCNHTQSHANLRLSQRD